MKTRKSDPDHKKRLFRQGRAFLILLAAVLLAKPLLEGIGYLSVKYQFGTWYLVVWVLLCLAYIALIYALSGSALDFLRTILDLFSRKRKQAKMEGVGVEQEWGVITEIRKADYTFNGKHPLYLCYRLDDQSLETRLTNYALQEAVGRRIPVYRHPDGTVYADQDGVEFPSTGGPETGDESLREKEWTLSLGTETVTIRDQSVPEEKRTELGGKTAPEPQAAGETNEKAPRRVPVPGLKQEKPEGPKTARERVRFSWSVMGVGLFFGGLGLLFLCIGIFAEEFGTFSVLSLIAFAIGAVPSAAAVSDYSRQKDIFLYGETLEAEITEVLRGETDGDGLAVYTVRCRAGERSFETRTISPPADAVGKTVTVFVSKKNQKHSSVALDTVR